MWVSVSFDWQNLICKISTEYYKFCLNIDKLLLDAKKPLLNSKTKYIVKDLKVYLLYSFLKHN